MTHAVLTRYELDCLKTLASACGWRLDCCPWAVVARLLALGLIERAPLTWLPVPMRSGRYRITAAGQVALARSAAC